MDLSLVASAFSPDISKKSLIGVFPGLFICWGTAIKGKNHDLDWEITFAKCWSGTSTRSWLEMEM